MIFPLLPFEFSTLHACYDHVHHYHHSLFPPFFCLFLLMHVVLLSLFSLLIMSILLLLPFFLMPLFHSTLSIDRQHHELHQLKEVDWYKVDEDCAFLLGVQTCRPSMLGLCAAPGGSVTGEESPVLPCTMFSRKLSLFSMPCGATLCALFFLWHQGVQQAQESQLPAHLHNQRYPFSPWWAQRYTLICSQWGAMGITGGFCG